MDEDGCDLADNLDCPSLLCEELEDEETKDESGSFGRDEGGEERVKPGKDEGIGTEQEEEEEEERGGEVRPVKLKAGEAEDPTWKLRTHSRSGRHKGARKGERRRRRGAEERDERRRGRKRRGKKGRRRRSSPEQEEERLEEGGASLALEAWSSRPAEERNDEEEEEQAAAASGCLSVRLTDSCDLLDPVSVGGGGAELYGSALPGPLLFSSQSVVPIQPGPAPAAPPPPPAAPPPPPAAPPPPPAQLHGTRRPPSPALPCGLTQPGPLEMEITQVYSTRRSIRYSTRGQGQALSFSLVPTLETVDGCLLPPAPKKKARTLYSTDQLEHLEALFHEDHYPDAEKRKVIATSVGVTPQRIMVWFQNRRAKWRKAERSLTAKVEAKQSGSRWSTSPQQRFNPSLSSSQGAPPSFPAHFASKVPPLPPAAPSFPTLSSQTLPSYNSLLASISSPGQSRLRDVGQHQGALADCHPRPMYSPPPLRRASLPLYPPPVSSLAPPLFLDALEGTAPSSCVQPLQTDASSLFDFMTSSQPSSSSSSSSSSNPYQLQGASYPGSQAQQHRMAYLTPSPYLTPSAPEPNPPSYLTLCPGATSSMMAYPSGGHAYYQPQSAGQLLLQPAPPHGAMYQSYPWAGVYSQPGLHQHSQHSQCPPGFPGSLASTQPSSSSSNSSLPSFFTLGEHQPTNPQPPPHVLTHSAATSCTSSATSSAAAATAAGVLPPVSGLQPLRLRAHLTPTKAASLLPPQVTPASPDSPTVTPCVKIENDSPQQIHSHFHCDFSPIHF